MISDREKLLSLKIQNAADTAAKNLISKLSRTGLGKDSYAFKMRVKPDASLMEKKIRKRKTKENYELTHITDVVGVRIVTLFRSEMLDMVTQMIDLINDDRDENFISSSLEEVILYVSNPDFDDMAPKIIESIIGRGVDAGIVSKLGTKAGYSSIHLVARLNVPDGLFVESELEHYKVPVEIQIRTVFEDAWGEIDHKLGYEVRTGKNKLGRDINASLSRHLRTLKSYTDACAEYANAINADAEGDNSSSTRETVIQIDRDELIAQRLASCGIPEEIVREFASIAGSDNSDMDDMDALPASLSIDHEIGIANSFKALYISASDSAKIDSKALEILEYYAKMNEGVHRLRSGTKQEILRAQSIYTDIVNKFPDHALPYFRLGQVFRELDDRDLSLENLLKAQELHMALKNLPLEQRLDRLPDSDKEHFTLYLPKVLGFMYWQKSRNFEAEDKERKLGYLCRAYEETVKFSEDGEQYSGLPDLLFASYVNNLLYYSVDYNKAVAPEENQFSRMLGKKIPIYLDQLKSIIKDSEISGLKRVRWLHTLMITMEYTEDEEGMKVAAGELLDIVFPGGEPVGNTGIGHDVAALAAKAQYLLRR